MKYINQIEPWYDQGEIRAMNQYLKSGGWLMEFKKTKEFEEMIAKFTGAKYCSVVTNGTVSLFIALKALGIGEGDEVIVPNITMVASPNAVILAGAKPVFIDIEEASLCLDVDKAKKAITKRTKAIMHVSFNGRAGNLMALKEFCKKRKIFLIEDAAQSLGSYYHKKHLGRQGIIGSFSFSVPKIITTGQGGALITNDKTLFEKILKIKDFGRLQGGADIHPDLGWNFKFTDLQAVIGIEQMKKITWRLQRKKVIYKLYKKYLAGVKKIKFISTNLKDTSPWFIDILVPDNTALMAYLKEQGIGTRLIYPALNTQPIFNLKGDFKVSERIAKQGLWLPSSSFLKDSQIKYICQKIKEFYAKK